MDNGTLGLPDDWNEDNIPSQKQLDQQALIRFKKLRQELAEGPFILSEDQSVNMDSNIRLLLNNKSVYPEIIEFVFEFGEYLRRGRQLDIWHSLLIYTYTQTTNKIEVETERHQWLSQIEVAMAKFRFNSVKKEGAIAALKAAVDWGLSSPERPQWIIAAAELLGVKTYDRTLQDTEEEAAALLALVKPHDSLYAKVLIYLNLAFAYRYHGEYKTAFIYAQQGLGMAYRLNKSQYIQGFLRLMLNYVITIPRLRTYAQTILDQLADMALFTYNIVDMGHYFGQLGPFHYRNGNYKEAVRYWQVSAKIFEQVNGHNYATTLQGLGMAYTQLGRYQEAENAFNKLQMFYTEFGNLTHQVWVMHCIGWNALRAGQPQKARERLQEAYDIAIERLDASNNFNERLIVNIRDDLDKAIAASEDEG